MLSLLLEKQKSVFCKILFDQLIEIKLDLVKVNAKEEILKKMTTYYSSTSERFKPRASL